MRYDVVMRRSVFSKPSDTDLERAKQYFNEHYTDAMTGASVGTHATSRSGSLTDFVFPVIRRASSTFSSMHDIMKIQPMAHPRSSIFYMNYAYDNEQYEFARGWCAVMPGALVLGTRSGIDESVQHTVYMIVSVQKAKVTMTGGGRIVTTKITDITPTSPVKQDELHAS